MKTRSVISLLAFLFLFPIINLFAVNDLVIKLPNSYSSVKGYIDKATLVLEPHGGYSEQSLYLNYSDHHQFSSSQQVEIIHRFELPQGAVVNDMWLWIGDSVMQAKVLDTWTARHIYDSITTTKRDPAYLYKIGNQYELRIFPLISGGYRRVKINFIVPTKWNGNTAVIEFPVAMLNSNNNSQKPLEVLFRTKQNIWGNPVIAEAPGQEFVNKADTLGFNYMFTLIQSTSQFSSLNLNYKLDISDGAFFSSTEGKDNLTYIQSVFSLKDAFGLKTDSSARKNLIALDLSGNFNKNFSELIPRLKSLLSNSLKPNDLFNIIVSGAGRTVKLFNQWKTADLQTINNSLNEFNSSSFGDSVSKVKLPRLVFADAGAYNNLGYNEIRNISDLRQFSFLADSYKYFSQADVVSYYNDLPGSSTMSLVYQSIDSLLARGGRFYSRAGFPQYPPQHYIPDMKEAFNSHGLVHLFRNPNGNIGAYFPEKFDYAIDTYFLSSNDPDVKTELTDVNGNAVVISKKIGKGLLIVAGISSAQDDIALRKMFSNAFLGLNKTWQPSGLPALLSAVEKEYNVNSFDKVLLVSNSDSVISVAQAKTFAREYIGKFKTVPVINSVNLLQGNNPVFASVSDNFIDYYGSGAVLKALSDLSSGANFESHINDWSFILQSLSPYSIPNPEQLSVEVTADHSKNGIIDFTQIKQNSEIGTTPRCFIGSALQAGEIEYKLTAKFPGIDSVKTFYYTFPVINNSVNKDTIIPSMLGYEKIKQLLSGQPVDTAKVVQMAMKYNLLCDFTAMLALEPNKDNHFMINPFDEGKLTHVEQSQFADSLDISVFPNPFNLQTKIIVSLKNPSRISLKIYDVLGKLVRELTENEDVAKGKVFIWDGRNDLNASVGSGIYFVMLHGKETNTGKDFLQSRKLLLIK